MNDAMPDHFETLAIRAGIERSQFAEHSEALFLTSSFVFASAAEAAAMFAGEREGFIYSRFTNPTVTMLQKRLAALEGAQGCIATASGMAAILATVMALLKSGDHIVAARGIFGASQTLFGAILPKFGVTASFVPGCDPEDFKKALKPNTKLVFIETPSNPLTEVHDIAALARISHEAGAYLAVDNCFCTPALQRPLEFGADLVIHSATKHLDGQGRVLGGAVCGAQPLIDEIFKFMRTAGPTLSPFNAWVILKGLDPEIARHGAIRAGAGAGATARGASGDHARFLSVARLPPSACACPAAAKGGRRDRFLRGQGRSGSRLARDRPMSLAVDHGESRRCEDDDHSSGEHDAWPHHAGGARRGRHQRRLAARRRWPRDGG